MNSWYFWKQNRKQEAIYSDIIELGDEIRLENVIEENPERSRQHVFPVETPKPETLRKETPTEPETEPSTSVVFDPSDLEFIYIPPGTFLMGSPDYELARNHDEAQHEVTLSKGFYLQTTPVTQKQWRALMDNNPSNFRGDELPVEGVSWHDCYSFVRKLNELSKDKYRLPSEAEWEYACRAGTFTAFTSGEMVHPYCVIDPALDAVGWYCGNSTRKTHPVARKIPNDWGLYDMHGNVCEWCLDWYGDYMSEPQTDPSGPNTGTGKVIRGGSWFSNAKNCRSACRFYWPLNSKTDFIGFRLVRQILE